MKNYFSIDELKARTVDYTISVLNKNKDKNNVEYITKSSLVSVIDFLRYLEDSQKEEN